MAVRTTNDPRTNASFELLTRRLSKLEKKQLQMEGEVTSRGGKGSSVAVATPSVPFKIGEVRDGSGIKPAVSVLVPGNAGIVRIQTITVFANTAQSGESMAQSIERAKQEIRVYRIEITDRERMNGVAIRILEPAHHPKDNPEKNKIQVVSLVTRSIGEDAVKYNPMKDPYDNFPFNAFVVRNDMGLTDAEKRFYVLGDSGILEAPSIPNANLIVGNVVNLETSASDAIVTFKVFASQADPTKTFADLDIDIAHIALRPFEEITDASGETDTKLRPGGPIADRSKTFTLISVVLPLGKRFKWVKTITKNGAGKPQVSTPASIVSFYAGGDPATAGIPELESFTISVQQRNNEHSIVTVSIKQFPNGTATGQRPFAVLLKRCVITVTEPGRPAVREKKIPLLDEEAVFVQGATTVFQRKVQHKANQEDIMFGATVFAINHTAAAPISRDATVATGNSTFSTAPSAPAGNLITTAPDDDTGDGDDAYADFTVFASALDATMTFREAGTDHIGIKLRKASGMPDDDPDNDNRIPKKIFPVENEDLDKPSIVCRVRGLKTGRRYIWAKNIGIRSGINAPSAKTDIPFRAGLMALDPSAVLISGVAVPGQKRNVRVFCYIVQTSPAVLLKNIELHQDENFGDGFEEIRQRRLKDKPEFQMPAVLVTGTGNITTNGAIVTGTGLSTQLAVGNYIITAGGQIRIVKTINSSTQVTVDRTFFPNETGVSFRYSTVGAVTRFKCHTPPMKSGVSYFFRIRAVGNLTKDSATFAQTAMAMPEAPTMAPSNPSLVDILFNTVQGDVKMGHAKVTFRLYASWERANTNRGGSGPNGEICFIDVGADAAKIVLIDDTDSDASERYPLPSGPILDPDPVTGFPRFFLDIESTVLTAGKFYKWLRNVTFRNGIPLRSTGTAIMFVAGGSPGTPGLPELSDLSIVLSPVMTAAGAQSSNQLEALVSFTQMKEQFSTGSAPTGKVNISNGSANITGNSGANFMTIPIRIGYRITVFPSGQTRTVVAIPTTTSLTVDSPFTVTALNASYSYTPYPVLLKRAIFMRQTNGGTLKNIEREPLLDDADLQTAGPKSFTKIIPTPKRTLVGVQVTLEAIKSAPGATANSRIITLDSMMSGDDPGYEDNGAPANNAEFSARWTKRGVLRARMRIGGGTVNSVESNMNTHTNTFVFCYFTMFISGVQRAYLWNPLNRVLSAALPSVPNDILFNLLYGYDFLCDIGRTGLLTSNNRIPGDVSDAQNELDNTGAIGMARATALFNDINANGGTLSFQFYVFTQRPITPPMIFGDSLRGALVGTAFISILPGWDVRDSGNPGGAV